jgi:hypothetical protein
MDVYSLRDTTFTAWDLRAFAADLGAECAPFRWHPERRVFLPVEVNDAMAEDAMSEAARTGKPYQITLDPPPADSRVAHAANTKPKPARPGKTSRTER